MFLEISVITIIFIIFVTEKLSKTLTYFTISLLLWTLFFYTFAACTDPGIVYRNSNNNNINQNIDNYISTGDVEAPNNNSNTQSNVNRNRNENEIECTLCNLRRPERASHCYKCGVCVEQVRFIFDLFILKYIMILTILTILSNYYFDNYSLIIIVLLLENVLEKKILSHFLFL